MIRILAALTFFAFPVAAQEAVQPERTFGVGAVKTATASDYMVIAAHPLAAEAGRAVLAEGGTAADAAVAVQLVLTLVEPQSSGLGGGAFALWWDADAKELTTYDGRETAPLAATPDYWLGEDGGPIGWFDAVPGGKSVGVPGTPALLETLHKAHGALPRPRLAEDAIRLAEEGFAVSPRLAASVAAASEYGLAAFPNAAAYFFPNGAPLAEGETLKNPALAETFRRFAEKGASPFYNGDLAMEVIAATRTSPVNPGMLTYQDFAAYQVKERPPVCHPYRGYRVCGMGPPSSGALTVGLLAGVPVAILSGRKHYYEAGDAAAMRTPLETFKALGADFVFLTNAAGSTRQEMGPGSLMAITDHINFSGRDPLIGLPGDDRFVSMVNAYDETLRFRLKFWADEEQITLHEGVYAWFSGPSFETPAEINAIRLLGADAVGMSTAPETIIARHIGLPVVAISCVTNFAAGMTGDALSHTETKTEAAKAEATFRRLIRAFVRSFSPETME